MSEKDNTLEWYTANKLKEVDPTARPTRGSGCGNELGDINSQLFWAECKQKHTKANITMDLKEDFLKLARKVPVDSLKEIFVIIENKFGHKFVIMESDAFFRLVNLAHGEE